MEVPEVGCTGCIAPTNFLLRGKGRKPHLLRWPLSKAPATLSCEDPAVKTRFRCEAPSAGRRFGASGRLAPGAAGGASMG